MIKNLFIKLEEINQIKKWRNISISLFCLVLIILYFFLFSCSEKKTESFDSIAEITINGMLFNDEYRNKKIIEITNNDKIKAVILHLNTPGGAVTPSETLYNLLSKLNSKKPLVILMEDMATSGGYMISMASNYLIAKNTTITGSIGVILESYEFVDMAKKLGIELKTFKTSELKGMPSFFEKNTSNSNKVIQEMIDDVYSFFVDLVKQNRQNKITNYKIATNGQAFTGRQALKLGLIDEIGDKDSALNYLKKQNIDISLPIIEINLKKKTRMEFLEEFTNIHFSKPKNYNNLFLIYTN